jgi:hypothetical protein
MRFPSADTDVSGRFRLAEVREDKPVSVWAEAPGHARERRDGIHVFGGRSIDIGACPVLPGTLLRGRIVDTQKRPISGAEIELSDYRHVLGHTISDDQTVWKLKSDAQGRFVSAHLPAGDAHILVFYPGKVRTWKLQKAQPGVPEVDLGDIELPDETRIRGVVLDQDGKPAPGVQVYADYDIRNLVKTDKNGRFELGGAGENAKHILLRSDEYFAPGPIDLPKQRDNLRLSVTKAYEIHGTAVDSETGKLVPIDTVQLCVVHRDRDGTYSLIG